MHKQARTVTFSQSQVSIKDINQLAEGKVSAILSGNKDFLNFIKRGADFVSNIVTEGKLIYGINTGLGDSCDVAIPYEFVMELPRHLYTYHGCGLGEYFSPAQTKAIIAVRLASLCKGYSGVRSALLQQLINF